MSHEQGIIHTRESEQPVSSRNGPTFFTHPLSVSPIDILNLQSVGNVNLELGTGDFDDAMYISNVNEVACTTKICNKRISDARQEWSAGRLGYRPIGASDAACSSEMCLEPYATNASVQSPHTGYNTHETRQASSRRSHKEDQSITN